MIKIKTSEPKTVWKANTFLGEGVLWVPSLKKIYFVDIKKKKNFYIKSFQKKKKYY